MERYYSAVFLGERILSVLTGIILISVVLAMKYYSLILLIVWRFGQEGVVTEIEKFNTFFRIKYNRRPE